MSRILASLLSILLLVPPASAQSDDDDAGDDEEISAVVASDGDGDGGGSWTLWLFALEEYRGRFSSNAATPAGEGVFAVPAAKDESDHDVRLFFDAGLSDPSDHFGAALSMGLWADVDDIAVGESTAFASVRDQGHPADNIWFDVYTLWAEYRSKGVVRKARGGRQSTHHGVPVTFDGGYLELALVHHYLDLFAFGGRTAHFFEVGNDTFEDWIGSAGFVVRPMEKLKIVLDYRFQQETALVRNAGEEGGVPAEDERAELTDHAYGLETWYQPVDWLLLRAELRGINEEISHVGGATRLEWDEMGLGLDAHVMGQVVTLREQVELEDPYFNILGESKPHVRWAVDGWKDYFTSYGTFGIHLGFNGRQIADGDPEPFNRSFGRGYLQLVAKDIGVAGPFVTFTFDAHLTMEGGELADDYMFTVGGSAGWDLDPVLAEIGTNYQRYKYDYYRDVRELSDVRTWYASVAYAPLDWLKIRARYEFEQFDRDIHTITFALSQRY